MQRLINEFIGTFFLVFTICVAAVYGRAGEYAPLAIAFVLMAVIYAGGHISKAHYNPAVSLAFWLRGGYIGVRELVHFVLVQFAGAVIAVALARALYSGGMSVSAVQIDVFPALIAEFLFTFLLVWVIMNVATAKADTGNQFYGLAIGFAVGGGIYTVGIVSLAIFNPAVALALVIVGKMNLADLWIPLSGNLAGAACAPVVFKLCHPGETGSHSSTEESEEP